MLAECYKCSQVSSQHGGATLAGQRSAGALPENLMVAGETFSPIRRSLVFTLVRPALTFSGYTPSCSSSSNTAGGVIAD